MGTFLNYQIKKRLPHSDQQSPLPTFKSNFANDNFLEFVTLTKFKTPCASFQKTFPEILFN